MRVRETVDAVIREVLSQARIVVLPLCEVADQIIQVGLVLQARASVGARRAASEPARDRVECTDSNEAVSEGRLRHLAPGIHRIGVPEDRRRVLSIRYLLQNPVLIAVLKLQPIARSADRIRQCCDELCGRVVGIRVNIRRVGIRGNREALSRYSCRGVVGVGLPIAVVDGDTAESVDLVQCGIASPGPCSGQIEFGTGLEPGQTVVAGGEVLPLGVGPVDELSQGVIGVAPGPEVRIIE